MAENIAQSAQDSEPELPNSIVRQINNVVAKASSKEMAEKLIGPKQINYN